MELVSSCFRTYTYLANEKSNTFFILCHNAKISDSYSIYDSLIDFLNYDFHTIQSALQALYGTTIFCYDNYLTNFQTIKNELSDIFKIKATSTNFKTELDDFALQFISNDYTIFTIHQILSKRDASSGGFEPVDTKYIERIRDKYFRFLLGIYSLNKPCDELINRGTMEKLKDAFQDYYLCVEDLYYTKIYPEFFLHTTPSHTFTIYKPPYRLSLIKQNILESFSANIKFEELLRIKKGHDKWQTMVEINYLNKKELEADQSEHGNPFKKWRFDHNNPPSENDLHNYYNDGLDFGTNIDIIKKELMMPDFYLPIKIAADLWNLYQNSHEDSTLKKNSTLYQKCYILEYIEDIFVLHCNYFIKSKNHIWQCAGCHKINYSAKQKFFCGKDCINKHRRDVQATIPHWDDHEKFRKRYSNRLEKIDNLKEEDYLNPELLSFFNSSIYNIYYLNYFLPQKANKISTADYDNTFTRLKHLILNFDKLYKSRENILSKDYNKQLEEKCTFITNEIESLTSYIDSL